MSDFEIEGKIDIDSSEANSKLKNTTKLTQRLGGAMKTAAKGMGIALAGAGALVANFVREASKMEDISTQFQVLTGNAGLARKAMKDLSDFSASTPFQFADIAAAGKQLLGFGFEVDELKDRLGEIGNVAAASGQPIQDISLIFGQVAAAGKLTGERLLQLQERAIPIGPALAKTMGIAETSVKEAVSAGKVDLATFQEAFASLSKEGGFAFQGLDKQSKTLSGTISTFKDNLSLFAAQLGKAVLPALRVVTKGFTNFVASLRSGGEAASNFQSTIRALVEGGIILKNIFVGVGETIGAAVGTAAGAIAQLVSGQFSQAWETATTGMEDIGEVIKERQTTINEELAEINNAYREEEKAQQEAAAMEEIALKDKVKKEVVKIEGLQGKELEAARKSTLGNLSQLQKSSNAELRAIGKAAALVQIGISTQEGALKAYAALAGIPVIGPALGSAAAGALVAYGAERAAKVAGFAEGGLVSGPIGTDVVPAMLTAGEVVVPRSNFNDLISAFGGNVGGAEGGQNVNVTLELNGELGSIIDAKVTERRALGISAI